MKKNLLIILIASMISGASMAQEVNHEKRGKRMTYEQMTEKMEDELHLDEKQSKKIAKLNKKYKQLIEGEQQKPGEPPSMRRNETHMGHHGNNNHGGGPGGNMGGMRPGGMGGPGGFGGGRGGMNGGPSDMGRHGMGPDSQQSVAYDYDKQQEKYDQKIKKILTNEQYAGYEKIRPQFASQRKIREFLLGSSDETEMPDHKRPPGGNMPMPPGGGRNEKKEGTLSKTGLGLTAGEQFVSGESYSSQETDENVIQVKGGTLHLTNCSINKSGGDSENGDATSFYGVNAAILASNEGTVNIQGGEITTQATGANGIVAFGGKVNITDVTIKCSKNLSRGIHATGGGEINARNLNIETSGNNSSVIATDRGGGIVTVDGGNYKTSGQDCAVCYSTGTITVNNITGESVKGEVAVIEGDNEININNCHMTSGDNRRGMMILQSGSGDAEGYNGRINVTGGDITLTSEEAPLVEITTSTKGTVCLKDVVLNIPSKILMRVDYNKRWHTTNPVAFLNLQTSKEAVYEGDIEVDNYGTSTVTIDKNVIWNGAYDTANTGKETTVIINGTWNLTKDSYVDKVVVNEGGIINRNGFQLITK